MSEVGSDAEEQVSVQSEGESDLPQVQNVTTDAGKPDAISVAGEPCTLAMRALSLSPLVLT